MDPKTFCKISYGMYTLCSKYGDKKNGQIVNAVSQVTSEPPSFLVCVSKKNLTHELIEKSKVFSISILSKSTSMQFIGRFGFKTGRAFDKFEGIEYKTGTTGAPIVLDNTIGYIDCKLTGQTDAGTHTIFIGEAVGAEILSDEEPMSYDYYHDVKKGKSPENAPTYIKDEVQHSTSKKESAASTKQQTVGGRGNAAKIETVGTLEGAKKQEASNVKEAKNLKKYRCTVCNYIYDPAKGDPDSGIKPGTAFEDIPDDWLCPVCGVGKDQFVVEE